MNYLYELAHFTIDATRSKLVGLRQLVSIGAYELETPDWRFSDGDISWTVKKMKTKRKPGSRPIKKGKKSP